MFGCNLDRLVSATVEFDNLGAGRQDYLLNGTLDGPSLFLNGVALQVRSGGAVPPLAGTAGRGQVMELPPLGLFFAVFPRAAAAACMS